ncbi:SPOR domain-containing protein [Candidatus Thiothrix sp. Deng01]|uniref:SPOR domain-containing protein n=1 Tax=Candidatus Thiothrix phosphatis TaxID=3112415 RepID=A0ABU6CUY6_9GAMM|nr:SPOR domain-containing protein [Candidatus Thiothrix sp. Deng01]MEB4590623.1 SPOR domain-containing protein [Candidatus Thiothrix sp. Deng01]
MSRGSLVKQRGFVFKLIHSLLLVAGAILLVLLYRAGKLPFVNYKPNLSGWSASINPDKHYNEDVWEPDNTHYYKTTQRRSAPVTRQQEETSYTDNRYAVQVAAGYDSRQLYVWRDQLLRDGYDAYLVSLNTPRGLMFKLRVGAYGSRLQAENMRDKLRSHFPSNFGASFIVEGN